METDFCHLIYLAIWQHQEKNSIALRLKTIIIKITSDSEGKNEWALKWI